MNLSQLYYYRALAETRSYQEAADKMFITQPTLSVAVSNLEKELGTTLISRKRHPVEFTEDGEEFCQCVTQALQIIDEHVDSIQKRSAERNSLLKIGIVFSAQSLLWSSILREFWMNSREKPHFMIRQGTTPDLLEDLKKGDIDVSLTGTMGKDEALAQIPCWSQSLTVAVDESNPLAAKKDEGIYLKDLIGKEVISYHMRGPVGPEIAELVKGTGLEVKQDFSDEITLCSMVNAHPSAVALVCHSWLIDSFSKIVTIPILDVPKNFHRFYLSHRTNLPKNATMLKRFVDSFSAYDFDAIKNN